MFKNYLLFALIIFITSCNDNVKNETKHRNECQKVLDVVTDCLDLYRGALDYIDNCGGVGLKEIEVLSSCDEILNYIEGK